MKQIIKIFLILFLSVDLQSHDEIKSIGIEGGFGQNTHFTDFSQIPDCPSCSPGYRNGIGEGPLFGITYDHQIYSWIYLYGRIRYSDISGSMSSSETTTIIINGADTEGEFTHYFDADLSSLSFEPGIKINPFWGLFFNIGFQSGILINKNYSQVERITQPEFQGTFANELGENTFSRERNVFSGELGNTNPLILSPIGSLSYQLPINKKRTFIIEPEISYAYGISNLINDDLVPLWTNNKLSFSISIKRSFKKEIIKEEIDNQYYKIDTVKIETENIASEQLVIGLENKQINTVETNDKIINEISISRIDTLLYPKQYSIEATLIAKGFNKDSSEINDPNYTIEEFVSNRLDPLLNYIFFDNNSSVIPSRYKRSNPNNFQDFNIEELFRDSTLDIYHNILNIIGKRLKERNTAKITLVGCNAGVDQEKDNTDLSKARALSVSTYLQDVWSIDKSRIDIKVNGLPQNASTPIDDPIKLAENRRVEIYSNDPELLAPVFIEKVDRKSNPPIIKFQITVNSDLPIKEWELISFQPSNRKNAYIINGTGKVPESIEWILSKDQKTIPQKDELLISELTLIDVRGNKKTITGNELNIDLITTPTTKRVNDQKAIEKFSLILFEFNNSKIEGDNKQIIEFIRTRIFENSEVEIIGFADKTGDEGHNQQLAMNRAKATKELLGKKDAKVRAEGSAYLLYDNDLPEGRFYCRTVNVIVRTNEDR